MRLDGDQPAELLDTGELQYFNSADFSPQGDRFATGASVHRTELDRFGNLRSVSLVAQIQMRRASTGQLIWSEDGEIGDPSAVTISPDGKLVFCCSWQQVLVFDAKSGDRLRSIVVYE